MRTPSRRVPQPARWHFLDRFIAVKSAATFSSNLESSTNAVMGEERLVGAHNSKAGKVEGAVPRFLQLTSAEER